MTSILDYRSVPPSHSQNPWVVAAALSVAHFIASGAAGLACGIALCYALSFLPWGWVHPDTFSWMIPLVACAALVWSAVMIVRRGGRGLRFRFFAVLPVAVLASLGLSYGLSSLPETSLRVEKEHGVRLPPSARNIQCRGDAWGMLDRTASALAEIDAADLPAFLKTLPPFERWGRTVEYPAPNSNHSIDTSGPRGFIRTWSGTEKLNSTYWCQSPTGSGVVIHIWILPGNTCLILIATDWS